MAAQSGCSAPVVPSLPPPTPKSPPQYPDLYGKRRETARVQMLEREIGFLEEELKSVERLHPASKCCKEIADFVIANPDPLIPTNKKNDDHVAFGNGSVECPVLACHRFAAAAAVMGALYHAAPAAVHAAVHVTVNRASVANRVSVALHYQSGNVAAHVPKPNAAKLIHVCAAKIAALYHHVRVHVLIALV